MLYVIIVNFSIFFQKFLLTNSYNSTTIMIVTIKIINKVEKAKVFEKGIFLFFGIIGLTNFFLFILSIYYEINLFNSSYEKFIEIQNLF